MKKYLENLNLYSNINFEILQACFLEDKQNNLSIQYFQQCLDLFYTLSNKTKKNELNQVGENFKSTLQEYILNKKITK